MNNINGNLINKLNEIGVVQKCEGEQFILKSGLKTDIYLDLRKLVSYPTLLKEISYELGKLVTKSETILVGVPIGGIPFADGVSMIYERPLIILRDKRKTYGRKQIIEGVVRNKRCTIIEDVITTGHSVCETIKKLIEEGLEIEEIIVVVDREQGGVKMLRKMGYTVKTLFKLSQLTRNYNINRSKNVKSYKGNKRRLELYDIIKQKNTNIVLSADMEEPSEILELVDILGPHICAVKVHIDAINFKNGGKNYFCNRLKILKKIHNMMVIEDRKYSDIGAIVSKQVDKVLDWADMVTAYGVIGEEMIRVLNEKDIGIILITQLSSKDNMLDCIYTNKMRDMAIKYENVVGFICQEYIAEGYLHFTPGVNIDINNDKMGQQYRRPKELLEGGTEIFIVGRGIYGAECPEEAVRRYKNECDGHY